MGVDRRGNFENGSIISTCFGYFVDSAALALSDGNHDNENFAVAHLVDKAAAGAGEFDFVPVLVAGELGRRQARVCEAFRKLLFEMQPGGRIERAPLFQGLLQKAVLIGHPARP